MICKGRYCSGGKRADCSPGSRENTIPDSYSGPLKADFVDEEGDCTKTPPLLKQEDQTALLIFQVESTYPPVRLSRGDGDNKSKSLHPHKEYSVKPTHMVWLCSTFRPTARTPSPNNEPLILICHGFTVVHQPMDEVKTMKKPYLLLLSRGLSAHGLLQTPGGGHVGSGGGGIEGRGGRLRLLFTDPPADTGVPVGVWCWKVRWGLGTGLIDGAPGSV